MSSVGMVPKFSWSRWYKSSQKDLQSPSLQVPSKQKLSEAKEFGPHKSPESGEPGLPLWVAQKQMGLEEEKILSSAHCPCVRDELLTFTMFVSSDPWFQENCT